MQSRQILESLQRRADVVLKWITYVTALFTLAGWLSGFFSWGNRGFFLLVRAHLASVGWLVIGLSILTLWIRTSRLNRRFIYRFTDDFKGDLKAKWDFEGDWRIAEPGTLLVTGSDAGGLTKVGALWENYTLSFKACIRQQCLGVIVRGQDLNNYYMFQINKDKIRPHRRVAIPVIDERQFAQIDQQGSPTQLSSALSVRFRTGWQILEPSIPITPSLEDWFNVKIVVEGESVRIYIDKQLLYQQDSFFKISTGKVGFRNYGSESALIKKVRVTVRV